MTLPKQALLQYMNGDFTAMRLDRFLSERNLGTRSQVKKLIAGGQVSVNGRIAERAEEQVDEAKDVICFRGEVLAHEAFVYYVLNKPAGVVSATNDNTARTVVELLEPGDRRNGLFPVGRLDKDTEGFLLLTNDGALAHSLLSPKRHVDKTYQAFLERPLSREAAERLEAGVDIGEAKPTLPCRIGFLQENLILLTLQEGKFHQVKRMLQAVDNRVLSLKRVSFGGLVLDEGLAPGKYRKLTEDEVKVLRDACRKTRNVT